MVKTEVKLMLEKLSRKTDAEEKLAAQILLDLNQEDQHCSEMKCACIGLSKEKQFMIGPPD